MAKVLPRAIGGKEANLKDYPWSISISAFNKKEKKHYHTCGGSIIARRFVLTAAHCVDHGVIDNERWKIEILGGGDGNRKNLKVISDIKEYLIHPSWNKDIFEGQDIALIRLKKPIKFSSSIKPIFLPNYKKPLKKMINGETRTSYAGWGNINPVIDEDPIIPEQLQIFDELYPLPLKGSVFWTRRINLEYYFAIHLTNWGWRIFSAGDFIAFHNIRKVTGFGAGDSGSGMFVYSKKWTDLLSNKSTSYVWRGFKKRPYLLAMVSAGAGHYDPDTKVLTEGSQMGTNVHALTPWILKTIFKTKKRN